MSGYRFLSGQVLPVPDPQVLSSLVTEHLPNCFGCGSANRQGLGLHPHYVGDRVVAEIDFAARFEGGPGLVHGGATAAFFDDLIGFVMIAHQLPGVTAKLDVNYLKPIPLGITLRGEAWMSRIEGRKMWAEAIGEDDTGTRYVEATGLFLHVGPEHFAKALQPSVYESDEYYP